ncbi:MAG: hypothetical protein GSR78_03165 [Desulfurococcales archaeon]|nr:hypothetical protein [Desulfurococcales archaeon]
MHHYTTLAVILLALLAGLAALPATAQTGISLVYDVTVYQTAVVSIGGEYSTMPVFYGKYIVFIDETGRANIKPLFQEAGITGLPRDHKRILMAFKPEPLRVVGEAALPETVYYMVDGSRLPYKCTKAVEVEARQGYYYYTQDGILVYALARGPGPVPGGTIYEVFPPGVVKDANTTVRIALIKADAPVCGSQAGSPGVLATIGVVSGLIAAGAVYSYTVWRSRVAESLWEPAYPVEAVDRY